jgi:hypothetical protein
MYNRRRTLDTGQPIAISNLAPIHRSGPESEWLGECSGWTVQGVFGAEYGPGDEVSHAIRRFQNACHGG